jgi:3-hydroxyacyl-[acyl-carrier-protein] dehydratase
LKLINDFFKVLETSVSNNGFITTIELNPAHIVYAGHFPGHPVTPGVIQMQIVHELLEKQLSRVLKLISMPQCKFLKILNPEETLRMTIHIEMNTIEELLNVKARGENGTDIFFKLNAVYQFI